jgi:hypothetical protein
MRRSFIDEVQEFMTIPLALVSLRLFYNKSLLKRLTGSDEVPTDYRAFLRVCEEIRAQKQPDGQRYVAIAGSRYHFIRWEDSMMKPLTYGALRDIDFNRDGRFSKEEMFMGFASGKIGFSNPVYRQLQDGRGDRQGISKWLDGARARRGDFQLCAAESRLHIRRHLRGRGFRNKPADDLTWASWISRASPIRSRIWIDHSGAAIRAARWQHAHGSHPHVPASRRRRRFSAFLTSQKQNEKFNKRLKWIPIILGAEIDPFLKFLSRISTASFQPSIPPSAQKVSSDGASSIPFIRSTK